MIRLMDSTVHINKTHRTSEQCNQINPSQMEKKNLRMTIMLLRLITFLLLIVALIVLATNTVMVSDTKKITFKDAYAYRYLLAVEVIGCAYILVQIVFAAVSISRGAFGGNFSIWLHQVADMVFALFFATGVGAGFGLTVDLKKQLQDFDTLVPGLDKFFQLIYTSTSLLLLATITMASAILSLSYYVVAE